VNLPEISITRPVLATVMSLVVVLIGALAYSRLPLREYPQIDEPIVSVSTNYPGASPEIIESQVTEPLEDVLSSIDGLRLMTSTSRQETSRISLEFALDRDPDAAAAEVRDRVSRARGRLPDEINEPVVAKVEADADPIIRLSFTGENYSALEITDYVERFVRDRLQAIPGVAEVQLNGGRQYAMRIWLDPLKLAAFNLTPQDVETALRQQNVELPSGRIESVDREFSVLAATDLTTAEQFSQLILKEAEGYQVTLRDVGRAELAAEDERQVIRFNGQPAVSFGIVRQATANPLEIKNALVEALPALQASLPPGMKIGFSYDSTRFIQSSIDNVFLTIAEAIALVVAVIFLFLRSLRATLIPLVTIPVSLIGSFALMSLFGFSLNTLTLLAMVLAIGLVVDDSIVMMENIHRRIERGQPPLRAALEGSREIRFAIIAMTLTLTAVYMPIAFLSGRTGRLFIEFALTLAGSVLVSGFVALTLSPMMSSRLLRRHEHPGAFYRGGEQALDWLTARYQRALARTLGLRWLVVLAAAGVGAASWLLFTGLKSELAPNEDRGSFSIAATAPPGATIGYMDTFAKEVEAIYPTIPEMSYYFVGAGIPTANEMRSFAGLVPWEERDRSTAEVVAEVRRTLAKIPGARASARMPSSLGTRGGGIPVQFVLQTSEPYTQLKEYVDAVVAEARKNPGLIDVDTDLRLDSPQFKVEVDRQRAAALGVEIETIGRTLETLLGGRVVTRFKRDGEQHDVIIQLPRAARASPSDLASIHLRGRDDTMVPLANLVMVEETVAAEELRHFDRLRAGIIRANLAPGYSLGEALAFFDDAAQRLLPQTVRTDYSGESREFRQSSGDLYVTFGLALAFIFLVLAAQFESFVAPLIVMLTVPLSMAGALLALQLTGNTLNVYSQIGLVTLIGLITKHGILIVEFANQIQARGVSKRQAVIEAAALRLRPILMTTGAMVLGAVPLALATGAGAQSRQQLGWVIVGGMTLGTVLTLFVIPTVYTLLARGRLQQDIAIVTMEAPAKAAE
jgi:multidrug efflux pump